MASLWPLFSFAFSATLIVIPELSFAGDEVEAFRACLSRERNIIYNNTKLCAVGKPVDLSGGDEAEGVRQELSCPAKDYQLGLVADRCRKESFVANSTESKNTLELRSKTDGEEGQDFIDGGPSIKSAPTYKPASMAKLSASTSRSLGTRIAKVPASVDAEEDTSSAIRKTGSLNSTKQKNISKSAQASVDDGLDSTAATSVAKPKAADRTTDTPANQTQARKNQSTDDGTASAAVGTSRDNTGRLARSSSADVDADLATCRQAQSKAQQCCGSPTACLTGQDRANYNQLMSGGSEDEGLSEACDRLNRASSLSGDLNGKVAALCTNNQYACQNTCAGLVTKYQNLLDQCGDDCDNYSTYRDTIAGLQSQQTSCASLSSKADELSIQTLSSGQDQGLAAACQQKAGSSSLGSASMPSYGDRTSSNASDYSSAAPTTGGQVSARSPTTFASGEATAAQLSSGSTAPLAQLSSGGSADPGQGGTYYGQAVPGQSAASVRPIPNGGGGFGTGGASTASNASARANPRAPGDSIISTDIDQGFRSGGYSQSPGGEGAAPGAPVRGLASVGRSNETLSGYEKLDLKDYLPGGKYYRDGGRTPAARRSEINPKEDDIFQRISNKYQEKCKLGELWRCQD